MMEIDDVIDALSEELGSRLSQAVSAWFSGDDRSLGSWRKMMRFELAGPLEGWLLGPYSQSLIARGIAPLGEAQAKFIVTRALVGTDDLREKLLDAPSVGTLTSSLWFVETLLAKAHQSRIVASLLRVVGGLFGQRSVEVDPAMTGRKRWRTAGPDSRHRGLDFQIRDQGETFNVNGFDWQMPRQDASNGPQASGCLCWLEYQTVEGNWV